MSVCELKAVFFSLINEDDPYKVPKQIDLKNWCTAFFQLFIENREERVPFFLETLSQEKCWENNSTMHRLRLNRRIAAREMIQPQNSRGGINPLNFQQRYLVACWCCLEEDIVGLFQEFKQRGKMDDITALKMLEQNLGPSEELAIYWTYVVSGCVSQLKLIGNVYEHGLNLALETFKPFVEAVEFFWSKIRSLPENKFDSQRSNEIIMEVAVRAARPSFRRHPEIFEFCICQMKPSMYQELLKRDENRIYSSLLILEDMLRLDLFQYLFDSFRADKVSHILYWKWLTFLSDIDEDSDYYANSKVNLFMRMWMKEGFDMHRFFILSEEMNNGRSSGIFLKPFVRKHYMEPVWAVLNKANPKQIEVFMNSDAFSTMRSTLENRRDSRSLMKLNSYRFAINEIPSTSQVRTNSFTAPEAKRLRTE